MHKTTDVIDMPAPSQRAEDTHNKAIIDPRLRLSFLRINDTRELIRCFKTSESSNLRHVQNALRARIHFIGRPSAMSEYGYVPSVRLSHIRYCTVTLQRHIFSKNVIKLSFARRLNRI